MLEFILASVWDFFYRRDLWICKPFNLRIMASTYDVDKESIREFLSLFYVDNAPGAGGGKRGGSKDFKYAKQLTALANREQTAITVELDDLAEYVQATNETLVDNIEKNARRYVSILGECVAELLPSFKTRETSAKDALDVFVEHRLRAAATNRAQDNMETDEAVNLAAIEAQFPSDLLRRFEVYFKPRSITKLVAIRDLRSSQIGKLVTVHGTIIRASEVRPLLSVATYSCDSCSAETFQPIAGSSFTPLSACNSEYCKGNKTGGRLQLQTRGSKFGRFQELKIQEQSTDVPAGHVPRCLTVHCCGENTRAGAAGDHVSVTGIFLPQAKSTAFAQMSAGLITDTFLDAHKVAPISKWDEGELGDELTDEELAEIADVDFYEKLAASIAPEVYGHEDVKKTLLLMLVGGVERTVGGLKIRGSINVCLMGDPGVAKSQLLSYIDRLAPRSQMTSGRGSTGVGLTASIMKDPVTGLMTLEAGALMLADQGVCCIDEFDKMNDSDRTALHEVMEQQTISIAKAGILTTLHARTSVLAAANPAYGRYNPNRSIAENINLPAALLSRFDLLWLLQDKANQEEDLKLAKHITYVHQHLIEPPTNVKALDMGFMRRYISACRKKNPTIPSTLSERLVGAYVELRNEARNSRETTFTSPRSLLAILRLSTSLARLRMSDVVIEDDVIEAIRLVERSRDSTKPGMSQQVRAVPVTEQISQIVRALRSAQAEGQSVITIKSIREKCAQKGFSVEQVDRCLDEYENINVWHINQNRTKLTFV
ncbi:unnamed protein product [Allacma fusca]|uniref:DNA helicase n=1 Tax=Allacma fusca TaxID=39272 RepID=A0A8J2L9T7_9HEXA|nr:unnamed protein product [Allacma fusca]